MNERTFYYIFKTLGPTVLITDDIVCNIFLINASRKLFVLHHSTSYQPTPLPPHTPGWVGPPLHTVTKLAYILDYYRFLFLNRFFHNQYHIDYVPVPLIFFLPLRTTFVRDLPTRPYLSVPITRH